MIIGRTFTCSKLSASHWGVTTGLLGSGDDVKDAMALLVLVRAEILRKDEGDDDLRMDRCASLTEAFLLCQGGRGRGLTTTNISFFGDTLTIFMNIPCNPRK